MTQQMLTTIASFVFSRATGVLLALACLAALIWFGGRYIGMNDQQKILAIGVLVILYLLVTVMRRLVVWVRGTTLKRRLKALQKDTAPEDQMAHKLDRVIQQLKSTHLGTAYRGTSALYALPWYMVIGPSAAGKSTLFARSGLHFPLKDNERFHVSGIGGTRDCDWWFSDQAILIDTAGRYTLEETNDEWLGFLRLLKANRPKLPINGVILALPIDQVLLSTPEEKAEHVKHLRARIQEIVHEFGVMFPIYVVLTKCDLLRGFEEFFADLTEEEIRQPWGIYLLEDTEDKKSDVQALIKQRMLALHQRLLSLRTAKMNLARHRDERINIYQFPNQFAGAMDKLQEFTQLLFKQNPYHETPWFAGIYFTSGTQEGTPLERQSKALLSVFKRMLAQPQRTGNMSRSFFIDHLFTRVIFPLQKAVRGNRRQQRFHRMAKALFFLGASGLTTLTGTTLFSIYTANLSLLHNYETQAETLSKRLNDDNTTEFERVEALVGLYRHYNSLDGITTYSPVDALTRHDLVKTHAEPMHALFIDTLQQHIEEAAIPQLITTLEEYNRSWKQRTEAERNTERATYYQFLETYLMLTSHRDRYQHDHVAAVISQLWLMSFVDDNLLHTYEQERALMTEMASLYLRDIHETRNEQHTNPWVAGRELATAAQDNLKTRADADALYQQLQATGNTRYRPITLASLVPSSASASIRNAQQVPGIFTRDAWYQLVAPSIRDLSEKASLGDWVLGVEGAGDAATVDRRLAEQLEIAVRQRYFNDYAAHWLQFVQGLRMTRHDNLPETVRAIKALGDEQGPLAAAYHRAAAELLLTDPFLNMEGVLDTAASSLSQAEDQPPARNIEAFERASATVRQLVLPLEQRSNSPILVSFLPEMQALASELEFMLVAADIDREARLYAEQLLSGNANGKQLYLTEIATRNLLTTLDRQSRASVQELVLQPVAQTWSIMLDSARRSLQQQWETEFYAQYTRNILGRYPFSDSTSEAAPRDVVTLFHPNQGTLWNFIAQDLNPFIVREGTQWRSREWQGQGINLNTTILREIDQARSVVQRLFDPQTNAIGMEYSLYPMQVPGVTESLFEVDGTAYRYRNEPQQWRNFSWHMRSQNSLAKVHTRSGSQANPTALQHNGQWAFLRLLQDAEIRHLQGNEYELTWQIDQQNQASTARFRIRADREDSLLSSPIQDQIRLPQQLFRS